MRALHSKPFILTASLAIVAALIGATGMYAAVTWGPWARQSPQPFVGTFVRASFTYPTEHTASGNLTFALLNATLILQSPSSLDPADVTITVSGPNATLMAFNGTTAVWLHQLTLVYLSNYYPHWVVEFPCGPGSVTGCRNIYVAYSTTFINPDGAIVGGFNTSLPSASMIESGALMSVWFPSGPGFSTTGDGFTFDLTMAGHPGEVTLTTT